MTETVCPMCKGSGEQTWPPDYQGRTKVVCPTCHGTGKAQPTVEETEQTLKKSFGVGDNTPAQPTVEDDISLCPSCNCMTHDILSDAKGDETYCGKCGKLKTTPAQPLGEEIVDLQYRIWQPNYSDRHANVHCRGARL